MHIVIATTEFVTEENFGGGLSNYSANLARILRAHGNKVSVLVVSSLDEEFVWENDITVHRVRFEDLGMRIKIKGASMLSNLFAPSILINKKVREINRNTPVDIVHFPSSGALALFRIKAIPTVVRLSTFQPAMRYAQKPVFDPQRENYALNIQEKLQMISVKKADSVFAPSKLAAQLTERVIKKRIEVIESPFTIDFNDIDESVYKKDLKDKKFFLFYGTLGYLKGIHVITEILNKLFESYPDCYFVFVGASSDMLYQGKMIKAEEYIIKNVLSQYHNHIYYFHAMRNKKQLYSLVKHAQACVLPSRFDNLPNTCIESMALGQIVVGTRGASFEQLIVDGANGFLIENEKSDQLFKCLVRILGMTEEEREKMGKRAQERTSLLRPDNIYEQVMDLYKRTIDEKN